MVISIDWVRFEFPIEAAIQQSLGVFSIMWQPSDLANIFVFNRVKQTGEL